MVILIRENPCFCKIPRYFRLKITLYCMRLSQINSSWAGMSSQHTFFAYPSSGTSAPAVFTWPLNLWSLLDSTWCPISPGACLVHKQKKSEDTIITHKIVSSSPCWGGVRSKCTCTGIFAINVAAGSQWKIKATKKQRWQSNFLWQSVGNKTLETHHVHRF